MGDDGTGTTTGARAGRNCGTRRELQGNPAEIRAGARGILRDDPGQGVERIQSSLVLDLSKPHHSKSPEQCSGLFRSPLSIVAVPVIRPAIVGVGSGSVIGRSIISGTVITVAGPIAIILAVGPGDAGPDSATRQTTRQAGTQAPRLCRRSDGDGANGGDNSHDGKCFFHTHLLALW